MCAQVVGGTRNGPGRAAIDEREKANNVKRDAKRLDPSRSASMASSAYRVVTPIDAGIWGFWRAAQAVCFPGLCG